MYEEYLTAEYLKLKYGIGFRDLTGAVSAGKVRAHDTHHDGVVTYTFHWGDVMKLLAEKRKDGKYDADR